jgi:hypothetical protein
MRVLAAVLLTVGCGRDDVFLLGGGSSGDAGPDTGPRDDGFVDPGDTGVDAGFDADTGPGFDRDADAPECIRPRDCFDQFGPPPPCPGGPSRWLCNEGGFCEVECLPEACANDCDCPFSTACIRGECIPAGRRNACCTNPDCPAGEVCIEPGGGRGVCEDSPDAGPFDSGRDAGPDAGRDAGPDTGIDAGIPDTGATPVGDPCMDQVDCGNAGFCIDEGQGFPGGYCSQDCSMGPGGSMCPMGATCRGFGRGNAICLDACANNAECRAGYICVQVGLDPQRVCWPMPSGSMNPNGNPVGGECVADGDCASGLTCLNFMGWPDGYCTQQFCDPLTNPCPSGSECFNFPGFFSVCLDTCPSGGTQSDCRPGYYCLGPTGQPGGCIPN